MPGTGRPADAAPPSLREVTTAYGSGLEMTVGHGSVATPGALAALDEAHRRFGLLPWHEVVHPAEVSARGGFVLGPASGYYLPFVRDTVFAWDPETVAALRRPDGSWVETGEEMTISGLGETMALIAAQGARALYDGPLADALVADMVERGGLITREDLLQYRPVVRRALAFGCGDWELRTNPRGSPRTWHRRSGDRRKARSSRSEVPEPTASRRR
jgi:gamma-glutamyltranspeptidase/glutathione hydrolase